MLIGDFYSACWVPLLRVSRWMEEVLGPTLAVYLLAVFWGWNEISPNCWDLPEGHSHTGVGYTRSATIGVLTSGSDRPLRWWSPSFLFSPACLSVWNDDIKFWSCTNLSWFYEHHNSLIFILSLIVICSWLVSM